MRAESVLHAGRPAWPALAQRVFRGEGRRKETKKADTPPTFPQRKLIKAKEGGGGKWRGPPGVTTQKSSTFFGRRLIVLAGLLSPSSGQIPSPAPPPPALAKVLPRGDGSVGHRSPDPHVTSRPLDFSRRPSHAPPVQSLSCPASRRPLATCKVQSANATTYARWNRVHIARQGESIRRKQMLTLWVPQLKSDELSTFPPLLKTKLFIGKN